MTKIELKLKQARGKIDQTMAVMCEAFMYLQEAEWTHKMIKIHEHDVYKALKELRQEVELDIVDQEKHNE